MLTVFFVLQSPQATQAGLTVRQRVAQLDLLGEIFLIPSMICLILALQLGGAQYAWSDGGVIALLVAFSGTLVAFGIIQILCPRTATIPARIAKDRSMIAGVILATCVSGTMMVFLWCIPLWFQGIKNTTALRSGINTIPILAAFCLGSGLSGLFVSRVGYYTPAAITSSLVMSIGAGLTLRWNPATSANDWSAHQILLGFGIGAVGLLDLFIG